MEKKVISFFVVIVLVLSGLGAVAVTNEDTEQNLMVKYSSVSISYPQLEINDYNSDYVEVDLQVASSYFATPGQPLVPMVVKSIELPFGVRNVKIEATPNNVVEYQLEKEIRPSPPFLPLITIENVNAVDINSFKDEEIYSSSELFPSSWYKSHVGCGRNADNEFVTYVAIQSYPVRYLPSESKILVAGSIDFTITYEDPEYNPFPASATWDMVIIAPQKFSNELQKLIDHKNSLNPPVRTYLKTTEDIYKEYNGLDKPEQIKYFIKHEIETNGTKYVLLVGALKSWIYGRPRDDDNQGSRDWNVPVRYNNLYDNPKYPLSGKIQDPGIITDLYYADIYKEGGEFEDWDPNGDGIIGAWDYPNKEVENDTGLDWYPDVSVGRLACITQKEVKIMVDKIINYEKNAYGTDWFSTMTVISGDGFLDQQDLNIQWDTKDLPDGDYTIYARSNNPDNVYGPVDVTHVKLDRTQPTNLTFNHDDYLIFNEYPFDPIAKICTVSEGDILGNTNYNYTPNEGEAFCNEFLHWAEVNFSNGILYIRGKSYDPQPYGDTTDIHVWINNSANQKVFETTIENLKTYYEGEWVTGERLLKGTGGALYYMSEFNKELLWTSNGRWTGQQDVINEMSKGAGFTFFNGHGAPVVWADHLAGIPGNRAHASIDGLWSLNPLQIPIFPMDRLKNNYKTSVVLVGGCHNSQFNVSLIASILKFPSMWTYGSPAPECWSWWLTRLSKRGAIACIGNTGLGYGVLGEECTSIGMDSGICIEFFKQYEANQILGDGIRQTQTNYVNNYDMTLQEHGKSLSQWEFMGDPSLKLGGYENQKQEVNIYVESSGTNADGVPGGTIQFYASTTNKETPNSYQWSFDKNDDGTYDTYKSGGNVAETWDLPGVYLVQVKAVYDDHEEIAETIVNIETENFPEKPTKPIGAATVKPNRPYTYQTNADYPYDLTYVFLWGDDTFDLVGPIEPGYSASATHTWKEKGNYDVQVMVVDEMYHFSEWSDPLSVTVSKTRTRQTINYTLIQLLQKFFQNYQNLSPILKNLLGL